MDFGDILNQWDEMQQKSRREEKKRRASSASHKKANADWVEKQTQEEMDTAPQKTSAPRIHADMEKWLNLYGTVDKDTLCKEEGERRMYTSVRELEAMREDATIDLHGLTRDEADKRLRAFITDCTAQKFKKILIIHGKGIHSEGNAPALQALVKCFLEQDKRLGRSGHPPAKDGGNGATWVILKNHDLEH